MFLATGEQYVFDLPYDGNEMLCVLWGAWLANERVGIDFENSCPYFLTGGSSLY